MMWMNKEKYLLFRDEAANLRKELWILQRKYERLLSYLGLHEWENPATSSRVEIITNEEYTKRMKDMVTNPFSGLNHWYDNMAHQQQAAQQGGRRK